MPRKGRGGSRSGTIGTAYSNRTDLNTPNVTVPGQEYGKQAAQAAAQKIVPMGASPVATAPQQRQPLTESLMARQPSVLPGAIPFTHPTERPQEPIQTGLPSGPGMGPEAMSTYNKPLTQTLAQLATLPSVTQGILDLSATARALGI
jgi:hypothetical protein